jgi:hypothetical protein
VVPCVGVAGYNYWSFSSVSSQNAKEQKNVSVGPERDKRIAVGSRDSCRDVRVRNAPADTPTVPSGANNVVSKAPDVSPLSSEEALKRATARLALAKQSGELLPMDLDDVVALQRQMKDKERTISIQQVQELLGSRDVDTSALALPE